MEQLLLLSISYPPQPALSRSTESLFSDQMVIEEKMKALASMDGHVTHTWLITIYHCWTNVIGYEMGIYPKLNQWETVLGLSLKLKDFGVTDALFQLEVLSWKMISLELLVGIRKKDLSGTEDYAKKNNNTHTKRQRWQGKTEKENDWFLGILSECLDAVVSEHSWIIVFNANKLFMWDFS